MFKAIIAVLLIVLSGKAHAMSDTDCLLLTMYHEAIGEPVEGQRAVADVVQNRMRIKGKSACAIMKEKAQFSFYPKMKTRKLDIDTALKLLEVLDMEPVVTENTTHFHATYVAPKWSKKLKRVVRIRQHIFYEGEKPKWANDLMLATK